MEELLSASRAEIADLAAQRDIAADRAGAIEADYDEERAARLQAEQVWPLLARAQWAVE